MEVNQSNIEITKSAPFMIRCTNVPQEFFQDKNATKKYFRHFGKVKLIMFRPKVRSLLVEYFTDESMMNALDIAGEYKGQIFQVSRDTTFTTKKATRKEHNPNWSNDPEVRAELEAMGGIGIAKKYNLRDEAMTVDAIGEQKEKNPKLKRSWKNKVFVSKQPKKEKLEMNLNSDQMELINILKCQAFTIEDKYRILDARDKLIRMKLRQAVELSKTRATVGICPDMCPEKERLMRETQHQIALYEQKENGRGMNSKLAVKQYSRSSADQEAPLPVELRPVTVLQMTMGYLMHRIIGLCINSDVNLAEWYHFLWDRMRGIRKDITQQELCCKGSVQLVEQCARFHIFCSARLVAEDPSVFDQKINTENLTKCLQTLKYMYNDLGLKGESCKNEPEFRAYIILLNLNDGNFMWEVQQLRTEIQHSKEVKFALEVHSALDKNNYVRFFKLVRSTTFLNACILMRYFIQVRIKALKTLLKCYSPRTPHSLLPLSDLTYILAFETVEAAIEFLEFYGLYTNEQRTHVILDKVSFIHPNYQFVLDRAINLVENKRKLSIGEVVCGNTLPPKIYENHIPQNSFDNKGYLNFKLYLDDIDLSLITNNEEIDSELDNVFNPIQDTNFDQNIVNPSYRNEAKNLDSKYNFKSESKSDVESRVENNRNSECLLKTSASIFGFGINIEKSTSSNIFGANIQHEKTPQIRNVYEHEQFVTHATSSTISTTNTFVLATSLQEEEKKEIFPLFRTSTNIFKKSNIQNNVLITKTLTNSSENAPVNIFGSVVAKNINDRSVVPHSNVVAENTSVEETNCTVDILLETKVPITIEDNERKRRKEDEKFTRQEEEVRKLELKVKRKLQELQEREKKQKLKEIEIDVTKTIETLLNNVEVKLRNDKLQRISDKFEKQKISKVFKIWQKNCLVLKRKRKSLDFSPLLFGTRTTQEEARELATSSQNLTLTYRKRYKYGHHLDVEIKPNIIINRIELFMLTYNLLVKRYLNLDKKVPKEIYWKITISLPNEIEFKCGLTQIEQILNNYIQWTNRNGMTCLIEQFQPNISQSVTYCVEKQKGLINSPKTNSNGFIFIASDLNDDLIERIVANLKNFGVFVRIPIVLILQNYSKNKSKLKLLIDERIISNYIIIVDKFRNLAPIVDEAFTFLANNNEKLPPLELDTLYNFLLRNLGTEIWKKMNSFGKCNSNYENCLKDPCTVIYLYNEALSKITKMLLNKACLEYATFPDVFKTFLPTDSPHSLPCDYKFFPSFWSHPMYLGKIETILNGLQLPKLVENWPANDEFELELTVSKYCAHIFNQPEKPFYKIMTIFLKHFELKNDFSNIKKVVWTNVIEIVIQEKLKQIEFSLYGTGFLNKSIYNQLVVVYDRSSLDQYREDDWFYINNPVIKHKISTMLHNPNTILENIEERIDFEVDIDRMLAKLNEPKQYNLTKLDEDLDECKHLIEDLEDSCNIQKKILSTSKNFLQHIIDEH